ncbi:MAG: ATP-dependent helicase, partial [Cenarchaeum sp. SB0661_bin_35]|nr:ATP-dependent helicase [Cenarchaeum sp. SB0661_bin_35]MYI52304.1 ATP-dependent helicase [Cenarchaeum sp. SB0673_bin_9]
TLYCPNQVGNFKKQNTFDRTIISDLPDKIEIKEYCSMTKEQATLYASVLREAELILAETNGIKRRGIILATLSKLKQVCNHPAHFLRDNSAILGRSGKMERLREMLEEVAESGDKTLIFTQFVEMGHMLKQYIQEALGREVLFLHGGTTRRQRDIMVERFGDDDSVQVLVVSLKAGGTGLNLTAANHVFHFDRWWNPAVEDQATDRAFRIGQTRNVQVRKMICAGTFEEKIDQMIEQKKAMAESVVGTGEAWLTEMSNDELHDILALSQEVVA